MVTLDKIFGLLKDERRRYVLYYLYEQDGPVAIRDVVETIENWEDDPPPEDSSLDKFERISLDIKYNHIPKSDEVQFIQYDSEQSVIQIQGSPPEFDTLVTIARLIEEPSS
ncbi:DUF7344 domain-containing protein [Natrinema salinisoli]|uniref:DUF7344 domain-containing protein n=1 Tax=Natrinema salinisoli TaxID=2878535 RepID=UPI001CF0BFD1|nr:hypothetical protein [Natrinema salinisoli]